MPVINRHFFVRVRALAGGETGCVDSGLRMFERKALVPHPIFFTRLKIVAFLCALLTCMPAFAQQPLELRAQFLAEVTPQLELPPDEASRYGALAADKLRQAGVSLAVPQYVVVVDRSPQVQALFVFWFPASGPVILIGASPVSTGRTGRFDYFETPLGVFDHTPANPDFRAEGTKNELGFRGYGVKGMRVYDLGWQTARRGWGKGGESSMRLQMHSTDPALAESRLGSVQSKGCIRIPASLNRLIDATGLLDAAYDLASAAGAHLWVVPVGRVAIASAGRYLVVVDSWRDVRPLWSPSPVVAP